MPGLECYPPASRRAIPRVLLPALGAVRGDACRKPAGSPLVGARDLVGGDVDTVPEVDVGDGQDERAQRLLVEMAGGLVPDVVGDRVGAITEAGDGFCQGERGPFGSVEARWFPPAR